MADRLFVYGIFLSERTQKAFGMSNPKYATVKGYVTVGAGEGYIVQAVPVDMKSLTLSGLIVDVDPKEWERIDKLEAAYEKVKIVTTDKEEAWIYRREGNHA